MAAIAVGFLAMAMIACGVGATCTTPAPTTTKSGNPVLTTDLVVTYWKTVQKPQYAVGETVGLLLDSTVVVGGQQVYQYMKIDGGPVSIVTWYDSVPHDQTGMVGTGPLPGGTMGNDVLKLCVWGTLPISAHHNTVVKLTFQKAGTYNIQFYELCHANHPVSKQTPSFVISVL